MSFDVNILLRLVDRLTAPSRKAGQSYQQMANNITRSSAQIRSASTATAASVSSIGTAFARTNAQAKGYFANLRKMQAQATAGARGGTYVGGNADTFRAIGGWMALRKSLTAGEDTAKAENKFRALVDDATPESMKRIREILDARMMRSGETYAELLGAAGDAAQIVGRSNIAGDIAVAASKLTNIDTAGKTVADFSENLAAVIGPNGTVMQLQQLGNMLAMQQKLGSATAGGTIEAYKNVVGSKGIYKFDQADMLTAIGMIKNMAPALQDSQIGNMAKYGIRTLAAPIQDMRKKLKALGLAPESFMTDGGFDIEKTQRMFHDMIQTEKGLKEFKNLFAGKNVLAGEFWSFLANMDPTKFIAYREAMSGTADALDDADQKRLEGLPGALNAIRASGWMLARMFGEGLTPAIVGFADIFAPTVGMFTDLMSRMSDNFPALTATATGWLGLVAALSMFGLVSQSAAMWARTAFLAPFRILAGVLTGVASGVGGAVAAIASVGRAALSAGGALGVLRFGLMALLRLSGIGLVIASVIAYWDELKAAFAGFSFGLSVGWEGSELQQALSWLTSNVPGLSSVLETVKSAFTWLFSGFGGSDAPDLGWFSTAQKAAEMLLNPLRTLKELWDSIKGIGASAWNGASGAVDSFKQWSGVGIPESMLQKPDTSDSSSSPKAVTPQNVTNTTNSNNVVNVSVTVNAQTNADPNAIGAAAANAVGSKVRGALSDAPHSAP